jgi:hypothetical protein
MFFFPLAFTFWVFVRNSFGSPVCRRTHVLWQACSASPAGAPSHAKHERTLKCTSPTRGRSPAPKSKTQFLGGGRGVGIFPPCISLPLGRLTGWKEGTAKLPHLSPGFRGFAIRERVTTRVSSGAEHRGNPTALVRRRSIGYLACSPSKKRAHSLMALSNVYPKALRVRF